LQNIVMTLMEEYGCLGIFLLITVENIFPPIPSEVILTFGGFLTTYTSLGIPEVIFFSTLGSLAGAAVLYALGCVLSKERMIKLASGRVGKLLCLNPSDIEKADAWFRTKGTKTVLLCRFVPVVRSLISIPAGMSRMELPIFFLYTTIGSVIWNTVLVSLGAALGESWGKIAYLAGEYSHIMLIVLTISAVSGIIWFYGNRDKN